MVALCIQYLKARSVMVIDVSGRVPRLHEPCASRTTLSIALQSDVQEYVSLLTERGHLWTALQMLDVSRFRLLLPV